MKHAAVLRLIRGAARAQKLRFPEHALDEMDVEGETRHSVARVLLRAKSVTLQDNGRYRLHGDGLVVIVHIEDQTVRVWTVYVG